MVDLYCWWMFEFEVSANEGSWALRASSAKGTRIFTALGRSKAAYENSINKEIRILPASASASASQVVTRHDLRVRAGNAAGSRFPGMVIRQDRAL